MPRNWVSAVNNPSSGQENSIESTENAVIDASRRNTSLRLNWSTRASIAGFNLAGTDFVANGFGHNAAAAIVGANKLYLYLRASKQLPQ